MVSCFKNIIILSLLALAVSCGQDGVAPALEAFDYSICDEIIIQNTNNATFQGLLQDGASASDPFTVCIEEDVTIGADGSSVSVNKNNILIIGVSQTTSVVKGLAPGVSNPTLYVRNLTLVPTTAGMFPNICFSNQYGSGTYLFDKIICSAPQAHSTMDGSAFQVGGNGAVSVNLTISNSVITSSRYAIGASGNNGASITSTLTSNTLTVNGSAISFMMNNGSTGVMNAAGNTMKYNGAGGGMNNEAINVFGNNSSSVTANDTSGSRKNFACKVASSAGTFSSVFSISVINGSSSGGTFTAAGTQNGGNTVGNCP